MTENMTENSYLSHISYIYDIYHPCIPNFHFNRLEQCYEFAKIEKSFARSEVLFQPRLHKAKLYIKL